MKKTTSLINQLENLLTPPLFLTQEEYDAFYTLVNNGKMVKADNPAHHCGVMAIPYNKTSKELFIVHHKKANQWIFPGGHIEKNELLETALVREMREELGITLPHTSFPFMFSVMPIDNKSHTCRTHFDTWFLLSVTEVFPDCSEFNETKWVSIPSAFTHITHLTYLNVLKRMQKSNLFVN